MASDLRPIFTRLRASLATHADSLVVSRDAPTHYCLEATPGPATMRAWRGEVRRARIPVAWVEIRKAYVSYHLMGVASEAGRISAGLRARMQGKTCFNFSKHEESLFAELEAVTARSLAAFRAAGFIW